MRIVIDMQGAQSESRFRGIGRYTISLVQAIVRNRGPHDVVLALNGGLIDSVPAIRSAFRGLLADEKIRVWHSCLPTRESDPRNRWRARAAESVREAFFRELEPDVIYITSLFEGYIDDAVTGLGDLPERIPVVVTLYDLVPLIQSEMYLAPNPSYEEFYRRKLEQLNKAQAWFAISQSAAEEGSRFLDLRSDAVTNISTAHDSDVFRKRNCSVPEREDLLSRVSVDREFILYAGGSDSRKNLHNLIAAYALLPASLRDAHLLVLAGRMPDGDVESLKLHARDLGLSPANLVFTGYVSDDDLARLYGLCRVFVFPSLHEGFGLPALEAMACGAPVIGSNATSIPEVIGNEAALFDPSSTSDIAKKIQMVLSDDQFRQALIDEGLERSKGFSWDKSARTALTAVEALLRATPEVGRSWGEISMRRREAYFELMSSLASIPSEPVPPLESDLLGLATAIARNRQESDAHVRACRLPTNIRWRIEGPFDSTYSLALLNRETARALSHLGHDIALHSTEGPGDFDPDPDFLAANPDLEMLHKKISQFPSTEYDVVSRNLYPPRVADLDSRLNLLHHYAWEESGFPAEWVAEFNRSLQGLTCLSHHVEKIMIDHGVRVPLSTSGCGVDHWERILPDSKYKLEAKSFRFLHVSSCFPRKGVEILLDAFGRAFTASDDVSLVIKTFPNPHNHVHEWIDRAKSVYPSFPDVVIIEQDLADGELKALYQQCHALVAPSKAEGFGLPLAEAMLSGLPVITTGWGGQLDFCTNDNAWLLEYDFVQADTHFSLFDSVWANPRSDHLSAVMLEVHSASSDELHRRAELAKEKLLRHFTWENVATRLVASARAWAEKPYEPELRLGWITTWNTRCGIATYSEHLIESLPVPVTVLAARNGQLISPPGDELYCWDQGEVFDPVVLEREIEARELTTVVVQFNYGLFELGVLNEFLKGQCEVGRTVVVTMHSTIDPVQNPRKKLASLRESLAMCSRILVHSIADVNRLKELGLVDNVTLFPHGIKDVSLPAIEPAESKDAFVIASYGFFLPHKGLLELISSISVLREAGRKVRLLMVNSEYPIKDSVELIVRAKERIRQLQLEPYVDLHTQFLPDEESLALLVQADLIVFPYQETGESASGAVRYGLAVEKPVAVTPLSIFDDVAPAVHRLPGFTPEAIADGISAIIDEVGAKTDIAQQIDVQAQRWRAAHRYSNLGCRLHGMLLALARQQAVGAQQEQITENLIRSNVL